MLVEIFGLLDVVDGDVGVKNVGNVLGLVGRFGIDVDADAGASDGDGDGDGDGAALGRRE